MISQTAPTEHTTGRENASPKDYAGVAFYSDYDLTELLYKNPVLDSGFLPLEPEDDAQAHSHAHTTTTTTTAKAHVQPSKTSKSDGTTTPPPATAAAAAKTKSAMKPSTSQNKRSSERRPSFIAVSTPTVHHHEHEHAASVHRGHTTGRRRHSSHSHVPMSWWPESDLIAQHHWVERDCGSADEEEEILEEEMWADCFYD
ncbi:hypothetical protein ABEF95_002896 [Exophiala dermatitidis]